MRHVTPKKQNESRCGVAAVELAAVLPMFLVMLLGMIEIGRGFETANTLELAIREGGRLASMEWDGIVPRESNPNAKVLQDINAFLVANGIPPNEATVEITSAEGDDEGETFVLYEPENKGRLFRIAISVDYNAVSGFPLKYLDGQRIYADVVFRAADVRDWR